MRNRKHLARAERERILRRWIMIGTGLTAALVVGLIGYGWYNLNVLQPEQPVLTVEGEQVTQRQFAARVALTQVDLLSRLQSARQLQSMFGDNPEIAQSFEQDISQLEGQLNNPVVLGQQVIEQMIGDILIRQEAQRRGVEVSQGDVDKAIQESFGFYPQGTPTPAPSLTPAPTATLNPTQQAEAEQTPTDTPDPQATDTSTATPRPTATEYTRAAFNTNYQTYLNNLSELGITEDDFRRIIRAELFRERLLADFESETPRQQEQVHARHILVAEEEQAGEVLARLEAGEDWADLAAEFSLDEGNKDQAGDLGWFQRGRMVEPFEEAAFSAEVGEIVGPVETTFGWHLIEVLGHEERPISEAQQQQAAQAALNEWLSQQRQSADVEVASDWLNAVPPVPGQ